MDIDSIKPVGDFILVRQCTKWDVFEDGSQGISQNGKPILYVQDAPKLSDVTNFVEIIDIGESVKDFTKDMCARYSKSGWGATVWCKEEAVDMQLISYEPDGAYWMVRQTDSELTSAIPSILFDHEGCEIYPLSDYVAIEMDSEPCGIKHEFGMEIPDGEEHLPVVGKIVAIGDKVKYATEIGEMCRIPHGQRTYGYKDKILCCVKDEDVLAILKK